MSVLGAVLAARVTDLTVLGITTAGVPVPAGSDAGSVGIGSLNELPDALADIVRAAYGDATSQIFLIAAVLSVLTLIAVLAIKEVPLRTKSGLEMQREAVQEAGRTA